MLYLDHAASSPMCDAAFDAINAYRASDYCGANPNSLHTPGRHAFAALEAARKRFSKLIGANRPSEVIFTSGGTESNGLAITGMLRALKKDPKQKGRTRVIISNIEHDSIIHLESALSALGFTTQMAPVNAAGFIEPGVLDKLMDTDVALVTVMLANNETACIQPVKELARVAHSYGALFHTDAVQAFGHMPLNMEDLGVDTCSFGAHKFGGPVGIGALYIRRHTKLIPEFIGSSQENGMRGGTPPVMLAESMVAAAQDAAEHEPERSAYVRELANKLLASVCFEGSPIESTSASILDEHHLPGTVSVTVDGIESQTLIGQLDARGFCVAGGSACSIGSLDPSHVLTSMGIARDKALGQLRISFNHHITEHELNEFVEALQEVCASYGKPIAEKKGF